VFFKIDVITDTSDMLDHSPSSLHVRSALQHVILGELPVAIPATSSNFFAVSKHVSSLVTLFSSIIAIVEGSLRKDISAWNIRMNQDNVVGFSVSHIFGTIRASTSTSMEVDLKTTSSSLVTAS
jgi:hypothetical protein